MREFFRGWKRKVGCVTLILACALTGWWVRSMRIADTGVVAFAETSWEVRSKSGSLAIMHHRRTGNGHSNLGSLISGIYGKIDRTHWTSQQIIPKQKLASGLYPIEFDWRYDTKTEYYGLTFASGESSSIWANPQTITFRTNTIGVPFAYFVIPFLSVSAWLLLSRSQPAKSTIEPPV